MAFFTISCFIFFVPSVDGAAIYKAQCVRCHGPSGEGTKQYKPRLEGDRSIAQLADVIHKTMPENAPGSLSAEQSQAVASYVHDAFYSRIARERNRPVRVELARLTTRQYRNVLADLVGSFRGTPGWTDQRGLKAEYFKNRRYRPMDRLIQRTDSQILLDFGVESPAPGKIEAHEFSARWNGSILADQTGEYEIVIRTEHAARLWLNDLKRPLIDAWVKSGNDTEYRATIFLVAGRLYSVRLEYSKAKQGVDDSAKTKGKEQPKVKSSIALLWKPPGRSQEAIPSANLLPINVPESYICSTSFPPDDRSYGWERGTTVSKEWDQAATDAALEAAAAIAERADELAGVKENDQERPRKYQLFSQAFAERAFRRPLNAEEKKRIERQLAVDADPVIGLKRVVLLVLKSPQFLYREVGNSRNDYDVAARLSFALWDSLPDAALLAAASAGKLSTRESIALQAERMLGDPRGRTKLRTFLLTWLKADQPLDLSRDAKKFPGFDSALVADMRSSLEYFLDDVVWSDTSDYRQLLLSDQVYVTGRMAKYFGVGSRVENGWAKAKLDDGKRSGVLTHPYLLAGFSHSTESSPIHRGVFLARSLLGVSLKAPPEAVAPLAPDLHPSLTTRERVTMQTRPANCMTCHEIINPLGFTLEHFDAVGRYRSEDHAKPVNAAGWYQARDGKTVKVNGSQELAAFVADSPEAHAAFAEQMFHHLVQQSIRAYGPDTLERLRKSFTANRYHIRRLAIEAATVAALGPPTKTTP